MNEKVQPFVDIIGSIYDNMDKTVHDVFSDDDTQGTASATAGDTSTDVKEDSPAPTSGFNEETPTKN